MKVVLQRVSEVHVRVEDQIKGKIESGLLILLGIETDDNETDIDWLCQKITSLRIFNDENDKMNLSIKELPEAGFLVISQFTLHASTKKGNRPSFIKAAKPEISIPLYEIFIQKLRDLSGLKVESGVFGADMKVHLINDGLVTIIIDSKNKE
ncbi:MAG: D-tyrosyl-tRNA(Tyr) deacylase [Saprospiraceae bacterium]|nr:D-tyrosyl-tRNA(Tyr) deacylase [Saprospiraceae bacterium]